MSHILTIDDGPTSQAVEKISYLNSKGIPSIWFCLGENLERNPDAALLAIKTGHIFANHSFSHPHFSEITFDEATDEIERTNALIDGLYKQSGLFRRGKLFRFPFGDQGQNKDGDISNDTDRVERKARLQKYLADAGFIPPPSEKYQYREPFVNKPDDIDWLWSYDIQEWAIHYNDPRYQLTEEQVRHNLYKYLKTFDYQKDQVILTHDHEDTSALFPVLIDTFIEAGVEFRLPEV
jgi:peptidoglycan/xylan/chitin deacetylase (PgdA/CDA1 family)